MERITLEDYLKKNGSVQSGITAKSNLIDKLEIYGFVNACKDEDMYYKNYNRGLVLNGIVNKEPKCQIILSNCIHQVTSHYSGNDITREGRVIPIFHTLAVSESEGQYNVEDIHIPSLIGKQLYLNIKSRYGNGVIVCDKDLKKEKFPSCISAVDGKAIMTAPAGHVQLLDKDGVIKSIGENIMVVCRYLHAETGTMCYTQYNLNEVFVDDLH